MTLKRKKFTTKAAAYERALVIRRQNVERHERATANAKLREDMQRASVNRNRQIQVSNLMEAATRRNGLDAMGLARLNQLQALVRKPKNGAV